MFTIDLLKGQGIPPKSRPECIVVAAVTFIVPVLIAIIIFSLYLSNKVTISVKEREIAAYQNKIEELTDAVKMQKAFENKKSVMTNTLVDTGAAIKRHMQWSPILVALAESMPDSMILTKLEVNQRTTRVKVLDRNDPSKEVDITIPSRTLRMCLAGEAQRDTDKSVRDFREKLRFSDALNSKLEDIPVSQGVDVLDGREIVSYEIDCIFKTQM